MSMMIDFDLVTAIRPLENVDFPMSDIWSHFNVLIVSNVSLS